MNDEFDQLYRELTGEGVYQEDIDVGTIDFDEISDPGDSSTGVILVNMITPVADKDFFYIISQDRIKDIPSERLKKAIEQALYDEDFKAKSGFKYAGDPEEVRIPEKFLHDLPANIKAIVNIYIT